MTAQSNSGLMNIKGIIVRLPSFFKYLQSGEVLFFNREALLLL